MIRRGFLLLALLFTGVAGGSLARTNGPVENSPKLTTPEFVNEWGYETEVHDVVTEDGYILTSFRVKRRYECVPVGAKVILFFGGFASSSDYYFLMTERPFLFNLVDDGYDVWMGNIRGSRYGKRHRILSPRDIDFWDYSNHELGFYDVPATIDYVLGKTASEKLAYIGYSQGTTIFFIMSSARPEYNEKIAVMFAFAPVVHFNYNNNIALRLISLYGAALLEFARKVKSLELLSIEGPTIDALLGICVDPKLYPSVCRKLVWEVSGSTNNGQNDDAARQILKYAESASLKTGVHYGQIFGSGKFRQYKYNSHAENLRRYGSLEPPEYNVRYTRAPIVLITATDDRVVNYKDVETLVKELPNVLYHEKFPYRYYGHESMIAARNASEYDYKIIVSLLPQVSFR